MVKERLADNENEANVVEEVSNGALVSWFQFNSMYTYSILTGDVWRQWEQTSRPNAAEMPIHPSTAFFDHNKLMGASAHLTDRRWFTFNFIWLQFHWEEEKKINKRTMTIGASASHWKWQKFIFIRVRWASAVCFILPSRYKHTHTPCRSRSWMQTLQLKYNMNRRREFLYKLTSLSMNSCGTLS